MLRPVIAPGHGGVQTGSTGYPATEAEEISICPGRQTEKSQELSSKRQKWKRHYLYRKNTLYMQQETLADMLVREDEDQ